MFWNVFLVISFHSFVVMSSSVRKPITVVLSKIHLLEQTLQQNIASKSLPVQLLANPFPPNNLDNLLTSDGKISSTSINDTQKQFLSDLSRAEIAICDPNALDIFGDYFTTDLKWLQSTFAGPDGTIKSIKNSKHLTDLTSNDDNKNGGVFLTRTGNKYNFPIAEYVISLMIGNLRNFRQLEKNQRLKKWEKNGYTYKKLNEISVGILGAGNIGMTIAEYLRGIGCTNIAGLTFSKREAKENDPIDKYYSFDELEWFLQSEKYDFLINALPSTKLTKYMLNYDILSKNLRSQPVWINVGRGDIIKETELIRCLTSDDEKTDEKEKEKEKEKINQFECDAGNAVLSGAILDVFEKEPLSENNPLWGMENVVITPHVSGIGFTEDVLDIFETNLELYLKDEPLVYIIDLLKGY